MSNDIVVTCNSQDALLLGCPFQGTHSYLFGFSVVCAEKRSPGGEGRHEGLVPRNYVLTSGFALYDVPLYLPLQE